MAVDYDIDLNALLISHPGDSTGLIPMIGYLRVSTAREDMISPELQADHVDRLGRTTGRRIVLWVADLDLSGRSFGTRRIVDIIESIEQGTSPEGAREIGVWKFSRFGRNRALNALYLGRLEAAGGALISATEQLDATTSIGRFTRGMMMELAAFESDRIAEGWADVQAYRRDRGLPNSGRARFGYIRKGRIKVGPEHWVDDPDDPAGERYEVDDDGFADEYRRMYEEAADGRSGYHIIRWLNRDLIPGPRGAVGKWTHSTLWPLLDSGFGCGYIRQHDPECTTHDTDKYGWCRNRTWLPGAHPHLWAHLPDGDATRDRIWKAYRARREASRKTPPRAVEARHELTRRVSCGWCEATMTAHRNNPGSDKYQWRCGGKTRGTCAHTNSASDDVLRAAVRDLLTREHRRLSAIADEISAHEATAHADREPETPRAEAVEGELERVRRKLDRLTERYADDDIPRDAYIRTRDKLLAERVELEAERAELEEAAEEEVRAPADYVPVMLPLLEEWDTMPTWSVNRVLGELVEIEVKRTSRTEGTAIIRTAWGTEERVDIVEPKGIAMRNARSSTRAQ
jgi:DNA invertase Pin-like site-specific DNA recombinase